ncbi:vacuolar amino acid transporter 2 [[Candida] jaroonii]|uniref:Vacuolar amino acid transporter 2 n=1 Tax=[Candida] jaroonii TaxID=467808 RepID=A0ACA9Y2M1_9ASCO|nr:vacuolar amino acid transporter 2 [[Candida] jaroonii]
MSKETRQYTSVPQGPDDVPTASSQLQEPPVPEEEFELESLDSLDFENNTPDQPEKGKSNMRMAFMNMANSILGAGIIGQPFAFKNSGLVGGLVSLAVLTFLIDWTLRLIVKNTLLSKTNSYQDFAAHCFGKFGRILLLFSVGSFAYGGCMAFCVIIGDTIPHVLKAFIPESITESSAFGWLFSRNIIITIFTTCISYPLSLNKDISKLAKASGFALFGMLIIVLITAIRGPFVDKDLKKPLTTQQWTVNTNIFQGISVISFALVCHHNTTFIYNSLKNSVKLKFDRLTHIVCFISMICCLVMAVNGLLNFGGNTKGNILNNFKSDDNWINVARFCFGLNMLTTFPLEIFVVRDVMRDVVYFYTHDTNEHGNHSGHFELSSRQHFFITSFLVFSSMAVSLLTCNLGIILELIGATSASLMAYIIPPLCYLKLSWEQVDYKSLTSSEKRQFHLYKTLPSVACALFGLSVMVISSFMSIRTSLKSSGEDDHCVVD